MVSDLVRAEVEGRQLTDAEVLSFLFLLLPAGMETTAQLIGNAAILLARFPEQLEQARADRAHIPRFLEEVLRYESPVQFAFRVATSDVELSGTLIPAGSFVMGLVASANRDALKQVLLILLDNALKYTPHNGKVSIHTSKHDERILIEVCDTGKGISPSVLPHVFERFAKSEDSRGSGLGLAIAKGLVEAHRGTIAAESGPAGTTMRVELPL